MNEHLILENFDNFITENSELFEESISASSVITDNITYEMYSNKLLEGFEESEAKHMRGLFDRQRSVLLEESSSLMGSPSAITYAVASFPMLVSIYADPLLSKVVSVYPSNVPTMSIPRLRWVSKIIDYKGNVTEVQFPSANQYVRSGFVDPFAVNTFDNIFKILGVTEDQYNFYINKRNFKIISVIVSDGTTSYNLPVIGVADARGNFVIPEVSVVNGTGTVISTIKVQGQINFQSGDVNWSISNMTGTVMTPVTATVRLRLMGIGNGKSVVRARPQQDVLDINCDIEDSFEIENIEEVIQDWKSLYNLDIIAQLKGFVKDQIKLNRDFEIADLLESNIPSAVAFGNYREIDLSKVSGSATQPQPQTVMDLFRNIIPALIALTEWIRKQTRMEIAYIVTGINAAAVLKSLQRFALKFEKQEGNMGFDGDVGSIQKLEIITSFAVGDDLIHLIPFAPTLSQATLVEIVYKPLYVITETTNSINRAFIKSRNWIGIVRSESIGTIKLLNFQSALNIPSSITSTSTGVGSGTTSVSAPLEFGA